MSDILKLNRLEYNILKCLHKNGCIDQYNSMTITELLEENKELLGVRMTVYRKLNKLNRAGYIKKELLMIMPIHSIWPAKRSKFLKGKHQIPEANISLREIISYMIKIQFGISWLTLWTGD